MNPRAKHVQYKKPFTLLVVFDNNESREFDLMPYLSYPIYKELNDESFCAKVHVQNGIVSWSNEIDFDPDRLYLESKSLTTV
jgi:hypothetical protein